MTEPLWSAFSIRVSVVSPIHARLACNGMRVDVNQKKIFPLHIFTSFSKAFGVTVAVSVQASQTLHVDLFSFDLSSRRDISVASRCFCLFVGLALQSEAAVLPFVCAGVFDTKL